MATNFLPDPLTSPGFPCSPPAIRRLFPAENNLIERTDSPTITRSQCRSQQRFKAHQEAVNTVRWVGDQLVSCSNDGLVRLWNFVPSSNDSASSVVLKSSKSLEGHKAAVYDVVGLADEGLFASCSADKSILIWDRRSQLKQGELKGHTSSVNCIAIADEPSAGQTVARHLASGSMDKTLRLWDLATGACTMQIRGAHSSNITAIARLSHNRIVSCGWDKKMAIHDLNSGRTIGTLHSDVYFAALCSDSSTKSSNSDLLCSVGWSESFDLHDLRAHPADNAAGPSSTIRSFEGHQDIVCDACFLPGKNGAHPASTLASVSKDGTLRIWNSEKGKSISCSALPSDLNPSCIGANRNFIAIGCSDGEITVLDSPNSSN